uniref:Uncharacterized protein n=1 Tax=Arundo donax TaxID=35708 RepID=A0A0A9F1N1_ARUDO
MYSFVISIKSTLPSMRYQPSFYLSLGCWIDKIPRVIFVLHSMLGVLRTIEGRTIGVPCSLW